MKVSEAIEKLEGILDSEGDMDLYADNERHKHYKKTTSVFVVAGETERFAVLEVEAPKEKGAIAQ